MLFLPAKSGIIYPARFCSGKTGGRKSRDNIQTWNRAGYYIFMLRFISSIFFFFSSPNLSAQR